MASFRGPKSLYSVAIDAASVIIAVYFLPDCRRRKIE